MTLKPILLLITPTRLFVSLLLVGLLLSALLIEQQSQYVYQSERAKVKAIAENHAALINTTVANSMSANYALAAMVRQSRGDLGFFEEYAKELLSIYPDVSHLTLSPNGIIRLVFPLAGNEASLGLNQLQFPAQRLEAQQAKDSRKLTVAGPIHMVQGGVAIVGRLPVLAENALGESEFWGFTNVAMKLETLLSKAKLDQLEGQGYDYRLLKQRIDGRHEVITPADTVALSDPVRVDIVLANGRWTLEIVPKVGWLTIANYLPSGSLAVFISGLIAVLAGLILHVHQGKQNLETVITLRAKEVTLANKRMTALLNAIPDLLFEIDSQGIVLNCHAPKADLLIADLNKTIGYQITEYLLPEAKAAYNAAMQEALETGNSAGETYWIVLNGKVQWFELSISLTYDLLEGEPCFVALSRDVTIRKEAEAELRIAATAFDSHDGIIITDAEHRIVRVNKAFKRITGYSDDDVLGKTTALINAGHKQEALYHKIYYELARDGYWQGELNNRKKDGSAYPEFITISAVYDEFNQTVNYIVTSRDISLRKQNEQTIQQLSFYDPLTGLPNRNLITDRISHLITSGDSTTLSCMLLFIDLDNFKDINDTKGHPAGDLLLQHVAQRLVELMRNSDMVVRFAGDEFIVLLESVDISDNPERAFVRAEHVAEKIQASLALPFHIGDGDVYISVSIGISEIGQQLSTLADTFKHAELAMYEAKAAGKNQICFYSPVMQEKILMRIEMAEAMRDALKQQQFILHFQPQFDREGHMKGAEALIRWQHPEKGMVPPGMFIPLAEETRQILPIGAWVIRSACETLAQWRHNAAVRHLTISVNVSVLQFEQADFVQMVESILKETGAIAHLLQFELTESMLASDQEDIIKKMTELKALGVLISLDDFGTGYSSLSYLQKLPIDQLKIDQSFVRALLVDKHSTSLALTISTMGHSLGLEVIAEGVETQEQLHLLKKYRCDLFQGYFTGYPMPVADIVDIANDGLVSVAL